jgi:hypothetical protein
VSAILGLAIPSNATASIRAPAFTEQTLSFATVQEEVELVRQINGDVEAVTAHESYVYAAIDSRLVVIDVSSPSRPTVVGQSGVLPGDIEDLTWADNRVYVANSTYGVRIIDVSIPSAPTELGVCDTPGEAYGVAASGNYAYVADGSSGFRICDVSAPSASTVIGSYTSLEGGFGYGVAISGTYAYVGAWGLYVLDISNQQAPSYVGSYNPSTPDGYTRKGISIVGDRVFSGEYRYTTPGADGGGMRITDVSDPANPSVLGFYASPSGRVDGVTVLNDYAYVADGDGGLCVIDISNPSTPAEVGAYDTSGDAEKVALASNYIYVADREGGLVTLWFGQSVIDTVPVAGGSITSTVDSTLYVFPLETFTDTVAFTHTAKFPGSAQSPGDLIGIDHFFEATATYSDTGQPAELAPGKTFTITVKYTDAEKGPAVEDTLRLYWWDETSSQWSKQGITSTLSTIDNLVVAEVNCLSDFAVLGETRRVYLPLNLRNH